jgi:hypothetical protein
MSWKQSSICVPQCFFDKEHCSEDRLVTGYRRLPWSDFFARTPLSEAACRDLIRLHGKDPDYMPGVSIAAEAG